MVLKGKESETKAKGLGTKKRRLNFVMNKQWKNLWHTMQKLLLSIKDKIMKTQLKNSELDWTHGDGGIVIDTVQY